VKTKSVRIGHDDAKEMQAIADNVGCSLNGLAQRSVKLWLEIEGPTYRAYGEELKRVRAKHRERQAVALEVVR
jgi:DNA-binding transcriptional MocR family regulator